MLRSERSVRVNIMIMRAFVKLREIVATHKELVEKVNALERKYQQHDVQIKAVFEAIRNFIEEPRALPKHRIGFLAEADRKS